jgi:hypothetical protein
MRDLIQRAALRVRGREWLPAILWAGAILAVSSIPSPEIGGGLFPGCDKLAHFIEYSILGSLLGFWVVSGGRSVPPVGATGAPGGRRAGPRPRLAVCLLAVAVLFAGLDEVHQRLIPGREMDFWDFSADTAGVVFGFVLARHRLPTILSAKREGEGRIDD